jgi:hypothetical protein
MQLSLVTTLAVFFGAKVSHVASKHFFLRAFLTSIKLDPENSEGEARFVLLPGMQRLVPKPPSSRLLEADTNKKDLPEPDRSSRSFIALPRYVGEQMTSKRLDAPRNIRSCPPSPLQRYWKLNSVITLLELPLNAGRRNVACCDTPRSIIPDNIQD